MKVQYVTHKDVDTVLDRIPIELRRRVRNIYLDADSNAVRRVGWVTRHGRRDIYLCATLPIRVSLRRYMYRELQAEEFGAPHRGQWPPWAVRRFLLYSTLLHELGHLQLVESSNGWDGEFAGEAKAQELANEWRGRLYSEPFPHQDPVHNAPRADELANIASWTKLDKQMRANVTDVLVAIPHLAFDVALRRAMTPGNTRMRRR